MSAWRLSADTEVKNPVVLVLQGDQAFWFRKQGLSSLESFSETLGVDDVDLHSSCPWIRTGEDAEPVDIQLVLDSHLDEVDRVKVENVSDGWLRHLQSWRMKRRLAREFPSASLHQLDAYAAPDVLSIVHNLVPEHWQEWLLLLQKEHVSVTQVVTGLELLCRYSATRLEAQRKLALFDIPAGDYSRHLLIDGGVPLFMRLVPATPARQATDDEQLIRQSLEHVHQQITKGVGSTVVITADGVKGGEGTLPDVPQLLANLTLGEAVDFRCCAPGDTQDCEDVAAGPTSVETTTNAQSQSDKHFNLFSNWRRKNINGQWPLTAKHRHATHLLALSVRRNALQLRIRQLQKATLACAWMAAATVVVASVHGVSSARERARLSADQQRVSERVAHLFSEASTLNSDPAYIVRSMERIELHRESAPVQADVVLTTVASALGYFPALVLDDLSWSVVHNEAGDTVFASVEQVPAREELWQEGSSAARWQVEFGGKVLSEQGLREQQRILEKFTDHLEAMPGVIHVKVLESPVNMARSSDHLAREETAYRVSLLLGVS